MSEGLHHPDAKAARDPLHALQEFRAAICGWFAREARDYPWRRTRDPYGILVSELMLQQTRVEAVLQRGFYERWMERFPDLASLAAAGDDEVLKAWEGLGYYRRARHLREAAREIVQRHGGVFPRTWEEVRALPGVGNYTAGAVAAFAFNEPAPMVDGNVARVLARLFDYREPVDAPAGKRQLEAWSRLLVDPLEARAFQGGLMELGQTVCLPRKPGCGVCPVARFCRASAPGELPAKRKPVAVERVEEWVLWMRQGDRLYLRREEGSRRRGLWRLPLAGRECPGELLLRMRYAITRYQVTMHVIRPETGDRDDSPGGAWFSTQELGNLALASPDRRAVEQLLRREREGDLWTRGVAG